MSKNNDVSRILVTGAAVAPAGVGTDLDALATGQIGVYDSDTNLAIDVAGAANAREYFLAVKLASGSIATSSGQKIQRNQISEYSFRPHTASQPMILQLSNYTANCDTDYAFRLEFRNQESYRRIGYNQFTKTYTVRTNCCDDCDTCPTGDSNEISLL